MNHLLLTISVPLWLLLLMLLFSLWACFRIFIAPVWRWYWRRQIRNLVKALNARLNFDLNPFRRTRRANLLDQLIYDPEILAELERQATSTGESRDILMQAVKRFAKDIVPDFNPWLYFRFGRALAGWLLRAFYRLKWVHLPVAALQAIPNDATVVVVANHRSTIDPIAIGYQAADYVALSYAVGEWAKIWPLAPLVRGLGGYMLERRSNDPLYRKVLERYVHLSTQYGVAQAIFPEGGLTLDGRMRPAKLGLLDYMLRAFDPVHGRDIVFVPLAVAYDLILEDDNLIAAGVLTDKRANQKSVLAILRRMGTQFFAALFKGRRAQYGSALLAAGMPISAASWVKNQGVDLRQLEDAARGLYVARLAEQLIGEIRALMPSPAVALVARAMLEADKSMDNAELMRWVQDLLQRIAGAGGLNHYQPQDIANLVAEGTALLLARDLIWRESDVFYQRPEQRGLLLYYANGLECLEKL